MDVDDTEERVKDASVGCLIRVQGPVEPRLENTAATTASSTSPAWMIGMLRNVSALNQTKAISNCSLRDGACRLALRHRLSPSFLGG